jgi:hypothetical protein
MPNTDMLKGIRCPKCKQEDSFFIVASQLVRVTDDGIHDEDGGWFWPDCRISSDWTHPISSVGYHLISRDWDHLISRDWDHPIS